MKIQYRILMLMVFVSLILATYQASALIANFSGTWAISGGTNNVLTGWKILPSSNIAISSITKTPGSTANRTYIYDSTKTSILDQGNFSGNTATLGNITLFAGTTYYLLVNVTTGSVQTHNFTSTYTMPQAFTSLNVSAGVDNSPADVTTQIWDVQNITYAVAVATGNVSVNNLIYNVSSYETASESFLANLTFGGGNNLSSANLIYNGTAYPATNVSLGNNSILTYNGLDIVTGTGTKNFFWNVIFTNGLSENTSTQTQTINLLNLTLCTGTPQNIKFVNYTFANETSLTQAVTANIVSTFSYWLGTGTINKTLSYTSGAEALSFAFCASPPDRTLKIIPSISYSNSYSPQRGYMPGLQSYTNTTTNTTLLLLPTSVGLFVSFQVQTLGGTRIPGATINITRSPFGLIESKQTDDSGIATFFLDPNGVYAITTFKSGYPLDTRTLTPTQTQYTIVLGGNSSTINDYNQGIGYFVTPSTTELNNDTTYTFNFSITSSFWALQSYGFRLRNVTGGTIASASGSQSGGGSAFTNYNVGNQSFIYMDYYWIINGTSSNGTKTWIIVNTADSGWSIGNVFTDLRTYLNNSADSDGLFGLSMATSSGNFSLALIIFLTIFCFAGVMSYKYGLSSGGAILGLIFTGVLFFDVGLGIAPNPVNAFPHFPTFFMGLILVGEIIREAIT